ncbi:preprotein translocase, SecA subunit [Orientia chuto str. Dubai]|uniref:Protein translocase subunit SecA n=1 Tax=Orientia chuto str. Dubai TaxID=1359168 RepID=A0A0F3MKW2_9RICK|nr:preprotein translocase subunit SecA [Candidatus Orientia mediorientalis]KJV56286.1 preprotein translocase, SecA subunit [Orientia chuto str. Dubai]
MLKFIRSIFKTSSDRIIADLRSKIQHIHSIESTLAQLSNGELRNKTSEFKARLANNEPIDSMQYEAFAVVKEAAKRTTGMQHYDEQLIGGILLHQGKVVEMSTGEGKTLVATLPSYLNALMGKGVHIVTVNDYLAQRDSDWMGTIHRFLNITVGCITSNTAESSRRIAYNSDITYVTNNELGFDFLRDNMQFNNKSKVQRSCNYAIIDEIDSILIDEARTPLIISGPVSDNTSLYPIINQLITKLNKDDYEKDEKLRNVTLTDLGINKLEKMLIEANLFAANSSSLYDFENMHLIHYINQSLKAHTLFRRNVDYLVKNGKVIIIDEFTGRTMDSRRYSEGLHQALEAKEKVEIQNENQTLASITFQNYFRMYTKLSGMTGTAITEATELKEIYNLDVVPIPTHKTVQRIDYDDEIYSTKKDKYSAIIQLIQQCYAKGQPVLVGTVSIEKSEELSKLLHSKKIPHNVLNAKHHDKEAYIIAQAGRLKAVTIATNMAGRGTDIMLGGNAEMLVDRANLAEEEYQKKLEKTKIQTEKEKEQVIKAGGLFVVGTERHESRRIDNQLRGRCGRQGDPGQTKFFLSLEDDLMRIFASDRVAKILRTIGLKDGEAIHHPLINRSLATAQQKIEAQNYEIRKNLLKYDNVMNDQRRVIYEQRNEAISSDNVNEILYNLTEELVIETVHNFIPPKSYKEDWNIQELVKEYQRIFNVKLQMDSIESASNSHEVIEYLTKTAFDIYKQQQQDYSAKSANEAIKHIFIKTLDQIWKEHLYTLDHLKQGISLRAYGQKDPLSEYKREAFNLFTQMLLNLKYLFIQRVARLHIDVDSSLNSSSLLNILGNNFQGKDINPTPTDISKYLGKISRNQLCPCNSGKKFKHCHGALK